MRRCWATVAVVGALVAGCSSARADVSDTTAIVTVATAAPTSTPPPTSTSPPSTAVTVDTPETTDVPEVTIETDAPTTTEADTIDTVAATADTADTISVPITPLSLPNLAAAFATLAAGNAATSISVWRDHVPVFSAASGLTTAGKPMTSDSPMVLASVSKLITALTIARLAEDGEVDVSEPMPWTKMFVAHDPAWDDVTVRELLDHTGGMPKAQSSWLNQPGSCGIPLTEALAAPPTITRGKWTYSNGNYCALGLLIEHITGTTRAKAAKQLIFDPLDVTGPHLTTDGLRPADAPYAQGVARLDRLGGAGTWLASTDDLAAMLDAVTPADLRTLQYPGIITDQYGWGHTGTVDGAKACAWVMEGGRTVVVAIVSGNRPATGGKVCDVVTPALAADLGIWADKPVRSPD